MERIKHRYGVKKLVMCALFTSLIAAGAMIKLPFPPVPFTLQLSFVLLSGLLLGPRLGPVSVVIYIILGLLGVPIFSGGGGLTYIVTPTFGYLLGFILCAFITGWSIQKIHTESIIKVLAINIASILCVYLIALPYVYILTHTITNNPIGIDKLLLSCFAIFLPTDLIQCFLVSLLYNRLVPFLSKMR